MRLRRKSPPQILRPLRDVLVDETLLSHTLFNVCLLEVVRYGLIEESSSYRFSSVYARLFIGKGLDNGEDYDNNKANIILNNILENIYIRIMGMGSVAGMIYGFYGIKDKSNLKEYLGDYHIIRIKRFLSSVYHDIQHVVGKFSSAVGKVKELPPSAVADIVHGVDSELVNKYIDMGRRTVPMTRECISIILKELERHYDHGVGKDEFDSQNIVDNFIGIVETSTRHLNIASDAMRDMMRSEEKQYG